MSTLLDCLEPDRNTMKASDLCVGLFKICKFTFMDVIFIFITYVLLVAIIPAHSAVPARLSLFISLLHHLPACDDVIILLINHRTLPVFPSVYCFDAQPFMRFLACLLSYCLCS